MQYTPLVDALYLKTIFAKIRGMIMPSRGDNIVRAINMQPLAPEWYKSNFLNRAVIMRDTHGFSSNDVLRIEEQIAAAFLASDAGMLKDILSKEAETATFVLAMNVKLWDNMKEMCILRQKHNHVNPIPPKEIDIELEKINHLATKYKLRLPPLPQTLEEYNQPQFSDGREMKESAAIQNGSACYFFVGAEPCHLLNTNANNNTGNGSPAGIPDNKTVSLTVWRKSLFSRENSHHEGQLFNTDVLYGTLSNRDFYHGCRPTNRGMAAISDDLRMALQLNNDGTAYLLRLIQRAYGDYWWSSMPIANEFLSMIKRFYSEMKYEKQPISVRFSMLYDFDLDSSGKITIWQLLQDRTATNYLYRPSGRYVAKNIIIDLNFESATFDLKAVARKIRSKLFGSIGIGNPDEKLQGHVYATNMHIDAIERGRRF